MQACSAVSSSLPEELVSPQKPVVGVIGDQSSDITIQVIQRAKRDFGDVKSYTDENDVATG